MKLRIISITTILLMSVLSSVVLANPDNTQSNQDATSQESSTDKNQKFIDKPILEKMEKEGVKIIAHSEDLNGRTALDVVKENRKPEDIKERRDDWWNFPAKNKKEEKINSYVKEEKKVAKDIRKVEKELSKGNLTEAQRNQLVKERDTLFDLWLEKKNETVKVMEQYGLVDSDHNHK
ncbi:hypothetical protein GCM10011351_26610 [Paraliobacillus quinghaiensis]|uniref:Uncharacterized protein n=1 Tax=Paraliobacillus quinghaiensis TaxID=470815 RepID=A0A917WY78_9BACI|nr:hypothetical protein [Paraliobacillus quinghaiensis]GGM39119.1 hypothetical protein GCM10011351_26610 [Paraliobacillus quinghaiensis]